MMLLFGPPSLLISSRHSLLYFLLLRHHHHHPTAITTFLRAKLQHCSKDTPLHQVAPFGGQRTVREQASAGEVEKDRFFSPKAKGCLARSRPTKEPSSKTWAAYALELGLLSAAQVLHQHWSCTLHAEYLGVFFRLLGLKSSDLRPILRIPCFSGRSQSWPVPQAAKEHVIPLYLSLTFSRVSVCILFSRVPVSSQISSPPFQLTPVGVVAYSDCSPIHLTHHLFSPLSPPGAAPLQPNLTVQ